MLQETKNIDKILGFLMRDISSADKWLYQCQFPIIIFWILVTQNLVERIEKKF